MMKSTEARPLFRGLAAVLAILGLLATIAIGWGKLDDSMLAGIGAFIGGGLFVLAMFFVAVTGRVPLSLAYFLAPPSAWESPTKEKDLEPDGAANPDKSGPIRAETNSTSSAVARDELWPDRSAVAPESGLSPDKSAAGSRR